MSLLGDCWDEELATRMRVERWEAEGGAVVAEKFVIVDVLDQTIGFWGLDGRTWTTHHAQALLYETRTEADAAIRDEKLTGAWVDVVDDEAEFRRRPATW